MPPITPTTRHDAHCHFFSDRFFETLGREKYRDASVTAKRVAGELGWEASGDPEALADRWVRELDHHKVSRAALMASVAGDEESVAAAVARYANRFVGFFALNPAAPDAQERATRGFASLGLKCACLFPAMHQYSFRDPCVLKVFEAAAQHGAVIFGHCGFLTIEARTRLGLPSLFDLRFGDPLALAATAVHFPTVPVIVPHFGAGFLREALMAAEMCPTIHFDTSSSNAWLRYFPGLTLSEVFRRSLALLGPDRLLFGTDSSSFPRGWREVIYGAQRTALDEVGVEPEVTRKIFATNFERIFPL
ncbi:MAG TPA: amidohydrolase family protein [Vicinamibacterales bacterium]|nr:amidohydrolase family protein [Vicinamibacterales bacterium]